MAKGKSFTRSTFSVSGLKDLENALRQLPKAAAKSTVRRTLLKAAEPIAEMASDEAPVLTGRLERNIIVSSKKPKGFDKGKIAYAKTLRNGGDRRAAVAAMKEARKGNPASFSQVFIGPTADLPHAIPEEFGTVHAPAQPYMRPAWDQKQTTSLDTIADTLGTEIMKTAARLAKRKARAR